MKLLLLLPLLAPFSAQDPLDSSSAIVASSALPAVGAALAERVDQGIYNGVVALVEIGGERIVEEVHGLRSMDPETPMELDSIFRIYSMTKPITSVAALMLVEEEQLGLEDPVAKYLPAFSDLTVGIDHLPVERAMTVRDLLRHTAGLTYGIFAQSEVDTLVRQANVLDHRITLEEMVVRLGELPLKTQPGSTFEYSLASDVLGRVIEVVSAMPLDRFFRERIFAPLGMVDTGFHVPDEKLQRVADVYRRQGNALAVVQGMGGSAPGLKPRLFSGGGGLFSTADDYMLFCRFLANQGQHDGQRLLQTETAALMASDQLGEIGGNRLALGGGTFGLSVAIVTRPNEVGPAAGSFWWGGLAGTGFWIDPESDVIGVFMIQNMSELNHSFAFQSDVYRSL